MDDELVPDKTREYLTTMVEHIINTGNNLYHIGDNDTNDFRKDIDLIIQASDDKGKLLDYVNESSSVRDRIAICRAYLEKYDIKPVQHVVEKPISYSHRDTERLYASINFDHEYLPKNIDVTNIDSTDVPSLFIREIEHSFTDKIMEKYREKVNYKVRYEPSSSNMIIEATIDVIIPKKGP